MLHWFKSYNISEWVDFDFWWSCIREDLLPMGLPPLVIKLILEILTGREEIQTD